MSKKITSIAIKSIVTVLAASSVILSLIGRGLVDADKAFFYFTIQSNIWIGLIFMIGLIYDVIIVSKGKDYRNNLYYVFKMVFTVSITLTFVVFATMLAPFIESTKLYTYTNITLHYIVPLMAIIDFILYDYKIVYKRYYQYFALCPPIIYMIFVYTASAFGLTFTDSGEKYPYFFMDYEKYTWFSIRNGTLGVIYYVIILLIFLIGITNVYRFAINKIKNNNDNTEQ